MRLSRRLFFFLLFTLAGCGSSSSSMNSAVSSASVGGVQRSNFGVLGFGRADTQDRIVRAPIRATTSYAPSQRQA
jgi:hypothetical protein